MQTLYNFTVAQFFPDKPEECDNYSVADIGAKNRGITSASRYVVHAFSLSNATLVAYLSQHLLFISFI